MLRIDRQLSINDAELDVIPVRAQGPGGQNVNKVASAVHLRFDIQNSSLPEIIKQRLLSRKDYRISNTGIIIIKAQRFRTRERNLDDARNRLRDLILSVKKINKKRIKTLPSKAARKKRMEVKNMRSNLKKLRTKVDLNE